MPEPQIIQRIFGIKPDKALVLGGADYLRPLSFGKNWGRIRIGVLSSVTPYGVLGDQNIPNVPFFVGLCNGMDSPVSAPVTRSFLGICATGNPQTAGNCLLTVNSSYLDYYSNAWCSIRKIDELMVAAASGGNYIPFVPSGQFPYTQQRRFPFYVEIYRPTSGPTPTIAANYVTITCYYLAHSNLAHTMLDYRPNEFLQGLDMVGPPIIQGITMSSSALSVYASDIHGYLDTLNLYWGNSGNPIEIHALGVSVQYTESYKGQPYVVPMTGGHHRMDNGYPNGTITSLFNGTEFSSAAIFPQVGSTGYNYGPAVSAAGTYQGTMYYDTGTWFAPVFYGTTAAGYPWDTFEYYATGSITTLSAGSNWGADGVIV